MMVRYHIVHARARINELISLVFNRQLSSSFLVGWSKQLLHPDDLEFQILPSRRASRFIGSHAFFIGTIVSALLQLGEAGFPISSGFCLPLVSR